jgi:hypothetical protein
VGGKGAKEISMSLLGVETISQQQVSIVAVATSDREVGSCIGTFMPICSGRDEGGD